MLPGTHKNRAGSQNHDFDGIVGHHPRLVAQLRIAAQVADSDATVLVQGESGTGKELVVRAIHRRSSRRREPFVAVNCGALAESLLASELFGHVRGAFTGAVGEKVGWFERAGSGTLFLDEVSEIPVSLQASLLRVLECGELSRVGSTVVRRSRARVVAATNQPLDELVRRGQMRRDLRYRLGVLEINLPPLRERSSDLPELIRHFLHHYNEQYEKRIAGLSPEAECLLLAHGYPGNVRELENAIHRAVLLTSGRFVEAASLPEGVHRDGDVSNLPDRGQLDSGQPGEDAAPADVGEFRLAKQRVVETFERTFLARALRTCRGNVTGAARAVSLDVKNFRIKMRQHGLDAASFKQTEEVGSSLQNDAGFGSRKRHGTSRPDPAVG